MGKKRKHRPKLTGRQSLEKWLEDRWREERKELQAEAEETAEPERPKRNPFKRKKEGPTLPASKAPTDEPRAPAKARAARAHEEKPSRPRRAQGKAAPGDPVEDDLIDWLFLRAAGAVHDAGPSGAPPEKIPAPPEAPRGTPPRKTLAPRPPKTPAPSQKTLAPSDEPRKPPSRWDFGRSAARALVSLMLCDGRITTTEKALVDGILRTAGEPPLEVEELRIWRPGEVPPPPDVPDVLDALAAVAHADGQRDPGEWRLVLAFGRSWGASETILQTLEERYHRPPKSSFRLLIEALRSYVAQARAELAERREDRHG